MALDEQFVVHQQARELVRRGLGNSLKTVLIVKGGPGAGKSVIAINLLTDLMWDGINAHYATDSRALIETLRKVIGMRGGAATAKVLRLLLVESIWGGCCAL